MTLLVSLLRHPRRPKRVATATIGRRKVRAPEPHVDDSTISNHTTSGGRSSTPIHHKVNTH